MVSEPQKELRFTRARQAVPFFISAAVLVGLAVTIFATGYYKSVNADVPHALWGLIPLALAAGLSWVGYHLAKHAYLILSPVGLEIFPFIKPARNMQLILWQQISAVEIDSATRTMVLHFNEEKTAGIHLSLSPIFEKSRSLLAKAMQGRVSKPSP